jgi:deoxyribodipyrimidine photo-lyase|tara:strand:- start:1722 stop:3140 length:1419 start_codon:yes stop_codon:yes gene_type:complete
MSKSIAIMWFRQDLRLSDNPALLAASKHENILPIYILDDENAGEMKMGAASRFWLHHSLNSLKSSLPELCVYQGDAIEIIDSLSKRYTIEAIYWNRCYEPWRISRDKIIKEKMHKQDIHVESFNASLLWEPWTIFKEDKTPYKVFTPFYRKGCLKSTPPRQVLPQPSSLNGVIDNQALTIDMLNLLPENRWDIELAKHWEIGEKGAQVALARFIDNGLSNYKKGRNFPAKKHTSHLSVHIHFGEISVHQIWDQIQSLPSDDNTDHFCSELGWREFSYSLLYQQPELPTKNLQTKFDNFPWQNNPMLLDAWRKGKTGFPIVDAGMRQLWQTGYVHNRLRMVVGSFLVKNLLIDWRYGERWFWDCLVDADHANNSASWQWVAGCGADAAPYFRIFNPITQGEKFDPDGSFTKKYIPELAHLPVKYLFSPWMAPSEVLAEANVTLGVNYPHPIVDLKASRETALAAFSDLGKKEI